MVAIAPCAPSPSARAPKVLTHLAAALVFALAAACTRSETGTPAPEGSTSPASTAPSAEPAASATASAEPSASAAAADDAAPADGAAPTAKAAADAARADAPAAKTDAAAPAAASTDAGVGCGTKPLPDCPLQAWMKAHANPPVMTNDLPGLAAALDKTASFAPPGYDHWASISKDGAAAARSGDLAAAKAACRSCHDQYKQKYKTELRARKI